MAFFFCSFHPIARMIVLGLLLLGETLALAQQGLPDATSGEISKFSVPERNGKGQLIWQLMGDHAKIRPDQKMEITHLVVRTFSGTNVTWTLISPDCVLDRATREAVSDSDVRIENEKIEITGRGFHWLANETRFIIRDRVRVIIRGGLTNKNKAS